MKKNILKKKLNHFNYIIKKKMIIGIGITEINMENIKNF